MGMSETKEKDFKKKLADLAKQNTKAFYSYDKSKLKTRSKISQLTQSDSTFTE